MKKSKRKSFTDEMKLRIVAFAERHSSRAAARKFGVRVSNVKLWRRKARLEETDGGKEEISMVQSRIKSAVVQPIHSSPQKIDFEEIKKEQLEKNENEKFEKEQFLQSAIHKALVSESELLEKAGSLQAIVNGRDGIEYLGQNAIDQGVIELWRKQAFDFHLTFENLVRQKDAIKF